MGVSASDSLPGVFQDVITLLETAKVPYLVIGGMAQAVIGEPRLTQDLHCIVSIPSAKMGALLDALQAQGFNVDRKVVLERIESTGAFSIMRGRWRVDVIVASTLLEDSAFRRAQRLRIYDVEANFPTPEDLILLKLVPSREKDLLDIKTVMSRHRDHLDKRYLEQWAQRLSDEAEDAGMWRTLQRLLREVETSSE